MKSSESKESIFYSYRWKRPTTSCVYSIQFLRNLDVLRSIKSLPEVKERETKKQLKKEERYFGLTIVKVTKSFSCCV